MFFLRKCVNVSRQTFPTLVKYYRVINRHKGQVAFNGSVFFDAFLIYSDVNPAETELIRKGFASLETLLDKSIIGGHPAGDPRFAFRRPKAKPTELNESTTLFK